MKTHIKYLAVILLIISVLIGAQVTLATWTQPTGEPPSENVPAPLNVGEELQEKVGTIKAGQFNSDRYCDSTGTVCSSISGGGGNELVVLQDSAPIYNGNANQSEVVDLEKMGYPANIIRVLLSTEGGQYNETICSGTGRDQSCGGVSSTAYPVIEYSNLTTDGVTITYDDTSKWITLLKGLSVPFAAVPADTQASLVAYECSGRCGDSIAPVCTVGFDWVIAGQSGSASRNFLQSEDPIAVGIYYHYDDDASIPWTETLDYRSWGGSIFDASEKGKIGYANITDYQNNRNELVAWDESFWAKIKPLNLIEGEIIQLENEVYLGSDRVGSDESIYEGDVQITATVTSCR